MSFDNVRYLDDITFEVRAGEIVGVAGVASNSQTILAETMTGLRKPSSGRVLVDGNDVTDDPQRACRIGVAHIPDDRIVGIVPDLTVADNASLFRLRDAGFARFGMRNQRAEYEHALCITERTDVRPRRPDLPVAALSGGISKSCSSAASLTGIPRPSLRMGRHRASTSAPRRKFAIDCRK